MHWQPSHHAISAELMDNREPLTEYDLLGERQIPNDAYYGIQTQRALENFNLTGVLMASSILIAPARGVSAWLGAQHHQLSFLFSCVPMRSMQNQRILAKSIPARNCDTT